jgi:hypothetical protein
MSGKCEVRSERAEAESQIRGSGQETTVGRDRRSAPTCRRRREVPMSDKCEVRSDKKAEHKPPVPIQGRRPVTEIQSTKHKAQSPPCPLALGGAMG